MRVCPFPQRHSPVQVFQREKAVRSGSVCWGSQPCPCSMGPTLDQETKGDRMGSHLCPLKTVLTRSPGNRRCQDAAPSLPWDLPV